MGFYDKNYRQNRAIAESKLKKIAPDIDNRPVIYTWFRVKMLSVYCGQAVKNKERAISHILAYDHLGKSIRKHGIYDKDKNPYGWRLKYYYCPETELDEKEKLEIAKYVNNENIDLFNITAGGQCAGKEYIGEIKPAKTYMDGIKQGKKVAIREIKELFEKYLVAEIKDKPNKVKERKLKEFYEIIANEL